MKHSLTSMVALCIENDVDFEVFHGESTNKSSGNRATMLIDFSPNPAIRIDFGDKKHGKLVSRIHVAGDYRLKLKIEQVIASIESHVTLNDWKTEATNENRVAAILRHGVGTDTVAAEGKVKDGAKFIENEGELFLTFDILVPQYVQNTITKSITQLDDVVVTVEHKVKDKESVRFSYDYLNTEGAVSYAEGVYIYPSTIRSAFIGSELD